MGSDSTTTSPRLWRLAGLSTLQVMAGRGQAVVTLQTSWARSPSPSWTDGRTGLRLSCPTTATSRDWDCFTVSRLALSLTAQVQDPWSPTSTPAMLSWQTVRLPVMVSLASPPHRPGPPSWCLSSHTRWARGDSHTQKNQGAAGTGQVRVMTSPGLTFSSEQALEVRRRSRAG